MSNLLRACNLFGGVDVCANADGTLEPVTSDFRLKSNILNYELGLNELMCLQPKTYYWNEKSGNDKTRQEVGFIAQEVQKVLPEAVRYNSDTGLLSLNYNAVLGLVVESINELEQRVTGLENGR
jgi:hypothetical protein